MLELYFREDNPKLVSSIIRDVEFEFGRVEIKDTPEIRELIKTIEGGEYVDSTKFIDRFGFTLSTMDLSTGCKAAILVALFPNKVVDFIECGVNAFNAAVEIVRNGKILYHEPNVSIGYSKKNEDKIKCKVDSYIFTSIDRLNEYLFNERPYKPDLNTSGIEEDTQDV